jgi:hypothetical protein
MDENVDACPLNHAGLLNEAVASTELSVTDGPHAGTRDSDSMRAAYTLLWSILLTLIEMYFGKSDLAAEPFAMATLARLNRRIGRYNFRGLFS